jgi:hypothetical protein
MAARGERLDGRSLWQQFTTFSRHIRSGSLKERFGNRHGLPSLHEAQTADLE